MADYKQPEYVEKRVRYFDGQFLKDQDFIDEQKYHIDRQRRHNRFLHVSGIIEGLTVKEETDLVNVEPGTAVDRQGQQIVLGHQASVPLADYRGQEVALVISYHDRESDIQLQEGSEGYTRFDETPELNVVGQNEEAPDSAIPLAKLWIDGSGNVTVDGNVRLYSGVLLPHDGTDREAWPTLRAGASGRVDLTGDLSVSGNVGIGTTDLGEWKLKVEGGPTYLGGGLEVRASSPIGDQRQSFATTDAQNSTFRIAHPEDKVVAIGGNKDHHLRLGGFEYDLSSFTPRLSIDTDGNVGIGTTEPIAHLDIMQEERTGTHPTSVKGLYVTGSLGPASNGVEFRHTNGTQGIGFGYNTIYATGTNANQHLNLMPRGTGKVGIGTTTPGSVLHIKSSEPNSGLTIQTGNNQNDQGIAFQNAGGLYTWHIHRKDVGSNKADLVFASGLNSDFEELEERVRFTNDGKVGIGTPNPKIHLAIGDNDTGLQQQGDGELAIYTNNQERLRIDKHGKVKRGDVEAFLIVGGRQEISTITTDQDFVTEYEWGSRTENELVLGWAQAWSNHYNQWGNSRIVVYYR